MATYWENSCSFGLRYVSWYKYLIVGLVFSHLGFWSGNLFLIAPFPDLCLLVPFNTVTLLSPVMQKGTKPLHETFVIFVSLHGLEKVKYALNRYCCNQNQTPI